MSIRVLLEKTHFQVLEKTEQLLEGLKSKLLNGHHGEGAPVVNGFRAGEGINGLASNGESGGDGDGGGGSETEVLVNSAPDSQPPVVTFTQVRPKMRV